MFKSTSGIETGRRGITYRTNGLPTSKTTIVCVHGWACDALDYTYLFDELSKLNVSTPAIAINLPGHGTSSEEFYPSGSVRSMAEAVIHLLEELEIEDVILIGHSMGVRIITEIWRLSQDKLKPKVSGAVFLDGSHYKLRMTLFAFDAGDARSEELTKDEKIAGITVAFQRMFSEQTPLEFQNRTLDHLRTMDLEYSENVRKGFIAYDRNDLDDALAALGHSRTPLLSFQATDVDDDNHRIQLRRGQSSKWIDFVQEKAPQVQQVVVEDSMHFPHVDQPAVVAEKLRDFLKQLNV